MKMFSALLLALMLMMVLSSCANLSKNLTKEGSVIIKNGAKEKFTWNDELNFNRVSWYHELTMQFDLLIAPMNLKSGFAHWLSDTEKSELLKCDDVKFALMYSVDSAIIPYSLLSSQLESSHITKVEGVEFRKDFLQHPDSAVYDFRLYRSFFMCITKKDKGSDLVVPINFPGYAEKNILL